MYGKCVQEGVQFVTGSQRGAFDALWLDDKDKTKVKGIITKDGTRHAADTVMMATGAWTAGLVPGVSSQLQATGQVVVQFKPKGVAKNILHNQPVWAADVANTGTILIFSDTSKIEKIEKEIHSNIFVQATMASP